MKLAVVAHFARADREGALALGAGLLAAAAEFDPFAEAAADGGR